MLFKKWKYSLEINKNTFLSLILKITILTNFFGFISCQNYQYKKIENCITNHELKNIINYHYLRNNRWILIELNLFARDYQDEIINQSKLLLLEYNNGKYNIQKIQIEGRDNYPLKPIAIDSYVENNIIYLYLLNAAFNKQRSIEKYILNQNKLIFKKRIRSKEFNNLISIIVDNQENILGVNYLGLLNFTQKSFFTYKDQNIDLLETSFYKILKVRKFNHLYFIQSEKKKIIISDPFLKQFIIKKFDYYPLDIFFSENYFYILLVENFTDFFNDKINLKITKNNNIYIYKISQNVFNKLENFDKYNSHIEVIQIHNSIEFENIINYENTSSRILMSSLFDYARLCEIPIVFSRDSK